MKKHGPQPGRKSITSAVAASIAAHLMIAVLAGLWIVSKYHRNEPPEFTAAPVPKIKIPPQTREHRMNLAAHAGLTAKPTFKARLVSLRPTAFALPEAPKISADHMISPDPAAMAAQMVTGLAGTAGAGAGGGFGLAGAGGKGLGGGINFMGVAAEGKRVLLLFDVSRSVVNKANASSVPLSKIKDETVLLIEKLPVDARFGIIQFVRNYKMFQPELIAATAPNRQLAKNWIATEWKETGMMPKNGKGVTAPDPNGLPPVLRAAFASKPDVIFLISDGSFERGSGGASEKIPPEELENLLRELTVGGKIPLHFIGFQMKEGDRDFWQKLVRKHGGSLKEL